MRLCKALLLALIGILGCLPLLAQDNITFNNTDGTFTGNLTSETLVLNGSLLTGISGFTGSLSGYNSNGSNLGTIHLITGALNTGSVMVPLTGQNSTFGAGGSFTVSSSVNGGFTFMGTFSDAHWSCVSTCSVIAGTGGNQWNGTWLFVGDIVNAILTVNGQQYMVPGGITVNLTTVCLPHQACAIRTGGTSGTVTFTDAGGTTNFNVTTPEPNTLALFGGGLLVLGFLARYDFLRRFSKSKS